MSYTGRFAPSPTGPLHYGSLVAALASYLDARHHKGTWLLRIEDLDPPRESASAPAEIIEQLKAFGLNWDGDVLFQGTRDAAYQDALKRLDQFGLTFPCVCTRKQVQGVYTGTCRNLTIDTVTGDYALRLRVNPGRVSIRDEVLGDLAWDLESEVGDFIIKRKDGLIAYQLAVVVDDDFQGVTHIVRGGDLLDSTPRQLAVYQALGLPVPHYLHIPVLVDQSGDKLSKQSHADPIATSGVMETLRLALADLGQSVQPGCNTVSDLLGSAARDWQVGQIPTVPKITAPDLKGDAE